MDPEAGARPDTAQTFGALLRALRSDAGLTQEALAERAAVSPRGIQNLESNAVQPQRETTRRLVAALAPTPEQRAALEALAQPRPRRRFGAAVGVAPAGAPTERSTAEAERSTGNLPAPLSSFVGREREAQEVARLLEQSRLVTLTGPGGTGKTRLALHVTARLAGRYTDGAWCVFLAAIADPELVPSAIAQALHLPPAPGRPPLDHLLVALHDSQRLLVLDNFEHLTDAAPVVSELLAACAGLRVLVTSRATLRLTGERTFHVPPLALPPASSAERAVPLRPLLERLAQSEAVRLFLERADAAGGFAPTEADALAVAEICRRLDGLPLAIELAAARIRLFSPAALLAHLSEHRLPLLTGGPRDAPARHQTLRGALDASYTLLTDAERRLFRRLAVFAGGCTLAAIPPVCLDAAGESASHPAAVIDAVSSLVEQSLLQPHIQPSQGTEPRYAMLETVREYALERLGHAGEREETQRRHAVHFLDWVRRAARELHGPSQAVWFERMDADHDNVRAALRWLVERGEGNDKEAISWGLQLCVTLESFWWPRAHHREAKAWLTRLLRANSALAAPSKTPEVALALGCLCRLLTRQRDFAAAQAAAEEALALGRELDDRHVIAQSLLRLVWVAPASAAIPNDVRRAWCEESVALHRALGDTTELAQALEQCGDAMGGIDAEIAYRWLDESLSLYRQLGDREGIANVLWKLGRRAFGAGDLAAAKRFGEEGLALCRAVGAPNGARPALELLEDIAFAQEDYAGAEAYAQERLTLAEEIGWPGEPSAVLAALGSLAWRGGRRALEAGAYYAEGLARGIQAQDKGPAAMCLAGLAELALAERQLERAARLAGSAQTLFEEPTTHARWRDDLQQHHLTRLREALVRVDRGTAWQAGRAMPLSQVVAYALEEIVPSAGPGAMSTTASRALSGAATGT